MNAKHILLAGAIVLLASGHAGCNGAMHTGKKGAGGTSVASSGDGGGSGGVAEGGGGGPAVGGAHGGAGGGAGAEGGAPGGAGGLSARGGSGGGAPSGGMGGRVLAGGTAGAVPSGGGTAGSSVVRGGAGGNVGGGAGGQSGAMTSLGGFPTAGTVSTTPIGDRPSTWIPPFVGSPLGAPGWQHSATPICESTIVGNSSAFDVWADERGVFALLSLSCSDGRFPCVAFAASVQLNSGSGWQLFQQFPSDATSYPTLLGGFPQGPLIMAGTFDKQFGLAFLDQKGLTFQGPMVGPAFAIGRATGGDLAYAFQDKRMVAYAAGTWSEVGEVGASMAGVWTDGRMVIAVGADQTVVVVPVDGVPTKLANVPAGDYTSVWGFGADDLWLSNGVQLVHYDGSKWQLHETGIVFSQIKQLWGDAGMVYFATDTEFGRWNGSSVEILLRPPSGTKLSEYPGSFGRFWGRSASEVFLPLRDARYEGYTCNSAFMLHFDGTLFHQF